VTAVTASLAPPIKFTITSLTSVPAAMINRLAFAVETLKYEKTRELENEEHPTIVSGPQKL